jgi:hypothetical protein
VHRIDSEYLRGTCHCRVHRHRGLVDDHRNTRCSCELVEDRGDTAAGRVAQAAQRRTGLIQQRVDHGPKTLCVGRDVGVQLELAAGEHDRRAVIADPAGDEDLVAGPQG